MKNITFAFALIVLPLGLFASEKQWKCVEQSAGVGFSEALVTVQRNFFTKKFILANKTIKISDFKAYGCNGLGENGALQGDEMCYHEGPGLFHSLDITVSKGMLDGSSNEAKYFYDEDNSFLGEHSERMQEYYDCHKEP